MTKKTMKPSGSVPFTGSFTDIFKGVAEIGGAAYIANAIKEHTRAMVALSYYGDREKRLLNRAHFGDAYDFADAFLAAGKKPTTPTENDQAA